MMKAMISISLLASLGIGAGCNKMNGGTQKVNKNSISFVEPAGGCGDIFVYKISEDKTKVIVVNAPKKELGLSTTPKVFDLEKGESKLEVYIDDYKGSQYDGGLYCNDLRNPDAPKPVRVDAKRGKVNIFISKGSTETFGEYYVTVTLEDIDFPDSSAPGSSLHIQNLNFNNVRVGWYAG